MKFEDLKKLRELFLNISRKEFNKIYKKAVNHVDEKYIDEQWKPFTDSPLYYLTWHSYGENIYNEILKYKKAKI